VCENLSKARKRGDAYEVERIERILDRFSRIEVSEDESIIKLNNSRESAIEEDVLSMLEERKSKIKKKIDSGTTQDLALTIEIYEKLDKKAVWSKKGHQPGVLRGALISSPDKLTSEERELLKSPHEIAIRYDKNGNIRNRPKERDKAMALTLNKFSDIFSVEKHELP